MSAEHIAGLASVDGGELLDHDLVQALLPALANGVLGVVAGALVLGAVMLLRRVRA